MRHSIRVFLTVTLGVCGALAVHAQESTLADATPLHWAAKHGLSTMVTRLIENGAIVDAQDQFGRTPLDMAVPYPDIVTILLAAGASVDHRDSFDRTPLHNALQYPETVALLLNAGASVGAQDYLGDTPLDRTLRYGTRSRNLQVISLLIDAGAGAP